MVKKKKMLKKLNLRMVIAGLTGVLLAAYAAYNVYILIKDTDVLPPDGKVISGIVALLFGILAAFVCTYGVKRPLFRMVRRVLFILTLLAIMILKLRLAGRVMAVYDASKPESVLYIAAYVLTVAALVCLFIYYVFIRKFHSRRPKAAVVLPILAMVFFLTCFVLEAILFFGYEIGLETTPLRTVVIRPIFYLGMIGLSASFLYPPQSKKGAVRRLVRVKNETE